MITPKDIERKTMTEAKRKEACNSIFAFYIGRPISYVLTIPFLYTNISPNTVTMASILFCIAGFGIVSFAQTTTLRLIGVLCFFLWNMGDGIDGNIARYKGLKSSNGDLLDTLGGYLAMSLMLLSMGNAAFFDTNGNVYLTSFLPVFLGGWSAVATLIPRVLMHRKNAQNKDANVSQLQDKSKYSISKVIMLNLCDPAGFQVVFIAIAILLNLATEFTIVYALINTVVMVYSIYNLLDK